jgi:hypothetical protein
MSLSTEPDVERCPEVDQALSVPAQPADDEDSRLVIVSSRGGDGLGVSFKVAGSGRVFRLEPTRDPSQPRFWCFRIYRCTSAGVVAQDERSWWGPGGMSRADLPAAVQAIRTDLNGWLADEAFAELRDWILGADDETPEEKELSPKRVRTTNSS